MSDTLLRGRILTFHQEPLGPDDTDAYSYVEDGAVLIRDGMIIASGNYEEVAPHPMMPRSKTTAPIC